MSQTGSKVPVRYCDENVHNIFSEMRATAMYPKIRAESPLPMPAWQVLRMATIDGATAVGIGVVLSALLYVIRSSTDISVVEVEELPDGRLVEREAPDTLKSDHITVLDVYGDLFYAGARTLERRLPATREVQNPVVILRLRGRASVGATLVEVLSSYADQLHEVNGRLYLTGISSEVHGQLANSGKLLLSGPVQIYHAYPIVGQSTREAVDDAKSWLYSLGTDTAESSDDEQ